MRAIMNLRDLKKTENAIHSRILIIIREANINEDLGD